MRIVECFYRLKSNRRLCAICSIVFPILILAVGVIPVLYYVLGPAEGYMTSDTTDSLLWAYEYYQTGELVSPGFTYAAIISIGGNQIFYPFLAMFGYSMAAQIGGLTLFVLLMAAALFWFATGMGLDRYRSAALTSVAILVLSSSAKLREIMWEHIFYYNLGILFFCVGFGLAARLLREGGILQGLSRRRPRDFIYLACLCVFSVLAALDGLQTLVCLTLPLLAGLLAERFFDVETPLLSRKNLWALLLILVVGVSSLLGMKLIDTVTGGIKASYAEMYSAYSDASKWTDNFLGFFNNWFSLLGVSVRAGEPLASLSSVFTVLRILFAFLLLGLPFALIGFWKRIESRGVKLALVGHLAVSAFILYAVTFGKLGDADWRLTPMLGSSLLVTFLAAWEMIRAKGLAMRFGALILTVMIAVSLVNLGVIGKMPADYGKNNSWHRVADELEARDLRYGYGNFWWAEIVTLLSDGEVQAANVNFSATDGVKKMNYQLPKNAFDDKETDRYFLLLTESEHNKMETWLSEQSADGKILDCFEVTSDPYNLRGYTGKVIYVYVFSDNLF
ncbi:MAG: hypothetical protein J6B71_02490 [Clostridia bacterium]|nr:hypothetical protein [Clostridia bacterium]